ncbi:hypothetical protein BF93_09680 [Brachybacterium phenoliresistens]|uniref:Uncharacterized protein n=1 Tax=Brachybacterium phenoliresistens TaxID=396014 RepID=Z9JNJ7_9MICO|nr:hypothetical protein BF93_09680 [Brachybacterium phenoliresistens]
MHRGAAPGGRGRTQQLGEDQQQMGLDHVHQRSGPVVVPGAALQRQGLLEADLDLLGTIRRGIAAGQALHGGHPEEVVDPMDTLRGRQPQDELFHVPGAAKIAPERLLESQMRPLTQSHVAQARAHPPRDLRRQGEVEDEPLGIGIAVQQPGEFARIRHVDPMMIGLVPDAVDRLGTGSARRQRICDQPGELAPGSVPPPHADHPQAPARFPRQQRSDPGQQESQGEIAGGAEDQQGRIGQGGLLEVELFESRPRVPG